MHFRNEKCIFKEKTASEPAAQPFRGPVMRTRDDRVGRVVVAEAPYRRPEDSKRTRNSREEKAINISGSLVARDLNSRNACDFA